MALGYIDKDFIEEGPFRCVFYDIEMDDPAGLSSVRLWLTGGGETYFMAQGQQKTDSDGNIVYVFNGDTLDGRPMDDDGTLRTETVIEDGEEVRRPVSQRLQPDRRYEAEVTFTLGVLDLRSVAARAKILVRRSYALP